ncbi:MAG: hypothetical protein GX610_22340 [Rhodococcus sp.]|nr:hypothetical protein [Rhodococcus sp. (in: high G+C Gram-positive bacteria)]
MNIDKRLMVLAAVPSAFGLMIPAVAQGQESAPTAVIQQVQQPGPPVYPFGVPGCNDYIDPWEDSVPEGGQPHYDRLDEWCENWQGDDDPYEGDNGEGENGVVPEDGVQPDNGDDDGGGTIYMN